MAIPRLGNVIRTTPEEEIEMKLKLYEQGLIDIEEIPEEYRPKQEEDKPAEE